jgi:raffinose/stachyose/melibiose transport system substrate-binding protein
MGGTMKLFGTPAAAGMLTVALTLGAASAWAQDKVTLRVWDSFTENSDGMDAMIAAFEAANPTIDVERDVQATEDMRAIIQTALNSGTGPDVFQYDTGPGFAGVLAKAGLIKPLDDLYAGPLASVLPWTKERVTFDGKTYGVGNQLEFIAVYYNKDLFAANNIAVPKTYAEFQAACTTLKDAGVTPIAFGNAAGWPAFHVFSAYANNMVPQDKLMAMIRAEASWDDPAVTSAIQAAFVDNEANGCFNASVNAVSYDDANALFAAGQSGMTITGGWMINGFKDNPFATGFFFLPAPDGMATMPPAGLGGGYFVNAATGQSEAANTFLAFLFDPANAALWVEGMSVIPSYSLEGAGVEMSPLLAEAAAALGAGAMGVNIDVLTPEAFNTVMLDGFQAVLGGDRTAAEQATALQASVAK